MCIDLGHGLTKSAEKRYVYNRTGATLTKGMLVMADIEMSDGDCDSIVPGEDGYNMINVIACTDAKALKGHPIYCCAETIENDKQGWVYVKSCFDPIDVQATADANATTNVDAGDALGLVVANNADGVEAYAAAGAIASGRILGLAFEDAHATVDGNIKALFWGGDPSLGWIPDTDT